MFQLSEKHFFHCLIQLNEFIKERRKEEAIVIGVTILSKASELQLTTFGGLCFIFLKTFN